MHFSGALNRAAPGRDAMDLKHLSTAEPPGKPGPIPFSATPPNHGLEGTISISPCVGNGHVVALEFHFAGKCLGTAALTEDSALDLALRVVGTIINRRRRAAPVIARREHG